MTTWVQKSICKLMWLFKFVHIVTFSMCNVYIIAWSSVVLGINSMRNAGSNFHEAKQSEISCITSAVNP